MQPLGVYIHFSKNIENFVVTSYYIFLSRLKANKLYLMFSIFYFVTHHNLGDILSLFKGIFIRRRVKTINTLLKSYKVNRRIFRILSNIFGRVF